MLDSLFDSKSAKKFEKIAKEKAKIHEKELAAAKEFMQATNRDTIINVLNITDTNGHPKEIELALQIRKKYDEGQDLDFDDIMTLDGLYKSNYKAFCNKGDQDE